MPYTLPLGSSLPHFALASTEGEIIASESLKSKYLVIFFTCNHCPYVIGSNESTRQSALRFQKADVQFVGINSNSPETYEEDSFFHMVEIMQDKKYPWLYLFDSTQEVAKLFGPLVTPHFFVFDEKRKLVYSGRAVDSPMEAKRAKTHDLDEALEALVKGKYIHTPLTNPIGCTIKWKGHDAHWMPPDACDLV